MADPNERVGCLLLAEATADPEAKQFPTLPISGIARALSTVLPPFVGPQLLLHDISERYEPYEIAVISPDARARAPP